MTATHTHFALIDVVRRHDWHHRIIRFIPRLAPLRVPPRAAATTRLVWQHAVIVATDLEWRVACASAYKIARLNILIGNDFVFAADGMDAVE